MASLKVELPEVTLAALQQNATTPAFDDEAEDRAWWESLSRAERQAEMATLKSSVEAADAGRTRPAEQVYERLKAKYAHRKPETGMSDANGQPAPYVGGNEGDSES